MDPIIEDRGTKFVRIFKKYGDPITAISIIIFLVFATFSIIHERELKEEISQNCGWAKEDYECFCEKSEAIAIKNKLKGDGAFLDLGNFSLNNVGLDK